VSRSVPPDASVYLLKGSDAVLLNEAAVGLVDRLVGENDRSLVLEELGVERYQIDDTAEIAIAPLVDAAQTPPFLTDRRVVVGRHVGVFGTKDRIAPLVDYLNDPLPTTALVLAWEKDPRPNRQKQLPPVPKTLADAIKKAGGVVIETGVSDRGKDREAWFDDQFEAAGLRLDRAARARVVAQLSGDPGRVHGLITTLTATFGPNTGLGVDDVEPYLGDASEVKPWDLTDAIDDGDVPRAMECLQRMMHAGSAHPLQVVATLHNHYARMLRLDGADVRGESEAAELLGMRGRSTFPAKKAMQVGRRLGSDRLHEFVQLLATADLDLKGASAVPDSAVIEVLVARLASRSRTAGRR
jgi:DNA polymerase-3 subunit delta